MSEWVAAYQRYLVLDAQDEIVYMTLAEAEALSMALADKVVAELPRPDLIVGLANGALLPATVVAERIGTPVEFIRVRRKSSRLKQRLSILKRFLQLPPSVLRWKPLNELNMAFNRQGSDIEEEPYSFEVAGLRVLLVDDCMDSGRSAKIVVQRLMSNGAIDVKIAVIGWGKKAWAILPDQIPPDVYLHRLLHFYPWANNSPHFKGFLSWLAKRKMELWR